jgi:hypothetical protein
MNTSSSGRPMVGAFVPSCDGDGYYAGVQCWGSTGGAAPTARGAAPCWACRAAISSCPAAWWCRHAGRSLGLPACLLPAARRLLLVLGHQRSAARCPFRG